MNRREVFAALVGLPLAGRVARAEPSGGELTVHAAPELTAVQVQEIVDTVLRQLPKSIRANRHGSRADMRTALGLPDGH